MTSGSHTSDGYLRVNGAMDVQAVDLARMCIEKYGTRADLPRAKDAHDRDIPLPMQLRGPLDYDPPVWGEFLRTCGVPWVACRCLGVEFRLFPAPSFIKHPNSRETVGWHCDEHLWGRQPDVGLTVWIPLVPVSRYAGCLQFIQGLIAELTGDSSLVPGPRITRLWTSGPFRRQYTFQRMLGIASYWIDAFFSPAASTNRLLIESLWFSLSGGALRTNSQSSPCW